MAGKKILEKVTRVSKSRKYGVVKIESMKLKPFVNRKVKLILRELLD